MNTRDNSPVSIIPRTTCFIGLLSTILEAINKCRKQEGNQNREVTFTRNQAGNYTQATDFEMKELELGDVERVSKSARCELTGGSKNGCAYAELHENEKAWIQSKRKQAVMATITVDGKCYPIDENDVSRCAKARWESLLLNADPGKQYTLAWTQRFIASEHSILKCRFAYADWLGAFAITALLIELYLLHRANLNEAYIAFVYTAMWPIVFFAIESIALYKNGKELNTVTVDWKSSFSPTTVMLMLMYIYAIVEDTMFMFVGVYVGIISTALHWVSAALPQQLGYGKLLKLEGILKCFAIMYIAVWSHQKLVFSLLFSMFQGCFNFFDCIHGHQMTARDCVFFWTAMVPVVAHCCYIVGRCCRKKGDDDAAQPSSALSTGGEDDDDQQQARREREQEAEGGAKGAILVDCCWRTLDFLRWVATEWSGLVRKVQDRLEQSVDSTLVVLLAAFLLVDGWQDWEFCQRSDFGDVVGLDEHALRVRLVMDVGVYVCAAAVLIGPLSECCRDDETHLNGRRIDEGEGDGEGVARTRREFADKYGGTDQWDTAPPEKQDAFGCVSIVRAVVACVGLLVLMVAAWIQKMSTCYKDSDEQQGNLVHWGHDSVVYGPAIVVLLCIWWEIRVCCTKCHSAPGCCKRGFCIDDEPTPAS